VEVADLLALIAARRLVTIIGTGGIGKTRAVLHVAGEIADHYPDGVWFVDLAPIVDPALVVRALAGVVDDRSLTTAVAPDDVARELADKDALLIFDNCEHLLAEVTAVIGAIVRGCPRVRIVATSREALGIVGEARYHLPLLALPPPDADLSARDALRFDAVVLFVERARAVRPSFAIDDGNAALVATIVRRLDGIALAIELAAARIEGSTLEALAARLDQRFGILTGGDASALPRQRTLRATLDWSFELLSDAEQTVLRRLAVFAGVFSIETAEAVCAGEHIAASDVAGLVASLVRRSLVVDESIDATSFILLETVRAYGRERLIAAGEADVVARRHAHGYAALAERAMADYAATPTRTWFELARRHRPNYRAALEWTLSERHDIVLGARLAAALLIALGDYDADESIRWAQDALEALEPGAHPSVEAYLCLRLANCERGLTSDRLRAAGERAVALYRTLDEPLRFTNALRVVAQVLFWYYPRDREAARGYAHEALAVARTSGDQLAIASALKTLALVLDVADIARKRELMDECLALSRRFGNELQVGSVLSWMSEMEFVAGDDIVRALGYGRAALRSAESSGSRMRLEIAAANVAMYAAGAGQWELAISTASRALHLSLESRSAAGITWAVQALASVAAGREDFARAARLLAFCDARCTTLHSPRQADQGEDVSARRLRVRLAAAMSPADLGRELRVGSTLSEEAAVGEALAVAVPNVPRPAPHQ
jgi:predicted ATPase